MKVCMAMTGASGIVYGVRLLEELAKVDCKTHVIISDNAKKLLKYEVGMDVESLSGLTTKLYDDNDMESPLASGSFSYNSMIVVPCSLKTLGAISHGLSSTLISRAAICCLKEGRKLILVPRETPLDIISLENMVMLKKAGAVILPAMPAFYQKPVKIIDVVNYIVGKLMEQIGFEHNLYKKWE